MKNKKIKIIFGIVLIFLFLLIEYKYRVETTKYELSEKYYLIYYDYSGKAEKSDIKKEYLLIITLVIILEIIVFLIASYILDKTDIKEEIVFLLIVPMFCIIMSLVIPLESGHDETPQFYREYGIVNGEILVGNQIMAPAAFKNTFETICSKINKPYYEILKCNEKIDSNVKVCVGITTTSYFYSNSWDIYNYKINNK